jgi:CHASE2 domain-containing sensor protein
MVNAAEPEHHNKKQLLLGLLVVVLLVVAKTQLEITAPGRWLITRGYEALHSVIPTYDPKEDMPVVVLDISNLKPAPDGTTSATSLRVIVDALIESGAKAIAIDVDFSPRLNTLEPVKTGARSEEDEGFFDFLHEKKERVPVFIGVHNVGVESKTWLGTEENKDLAVSMALFENEADSTEVQAWRECDGYTRLNSISRALAEASGKRPEPTWWLRPFLVDYDDPHFVKSSAENDKAGKPVICRQAYTLVNYGKLELIEKLAEQTLDQTSISAARNTEGQSKFKDKLVLIGYAQRDHSVDRYPIIGRNGPNETYAGIFVHAIATYTLVAEPVYRFKHWVAILLDFLVGAIVVIGVFLARKRDKPGAIISPETKFILLAIFLVIIFGWTLVRVFNVLWLDFWLVLLALLLHSRVHHIFGQLLDRFSWRPLSAPSD